MVTRPETAPETPDVAPGAPNVADLGQDTTPAENGPQNGTQGRDHRHPRCPRCLTIWHQAGNRTGHCRACCRTFDSLAAFDRHRRDGGCLDPAVWVNGDGTPIFESRTITDPSRLDVGTQYWRLTLTDQQAARFDRLATEHTGPTR